MAANFPSSPTVGQIFNAASGASFVWDGVAWAQAVVRTALPKNYIVNPAMQIQQDTVVQAGATYIADQWLAAYSTGATPDREASTSPDGGRHMLHLFQSAAKTTLAANDWLGWQYYGEGQRVTEFQWGTANAKQVILRFVFWTDTAGTYGVSLHNGDTTRSYVETFTISTGQRNTYVYLTFVVPGDTAGVWATDHTRGIGVDVTCASGSDYVTATKGWQGLGKYAHSSVTNNIATAGRDFYLMDVGLFLDPYKTGLAPQFWHRPVHITELRRSQRYWYKAYGLRGVTPTTQKFNEAHMPHPVPMRIAPAATLVGGVRAYEGTTVAVISSITHNSSSTMAAGLNTDTASAVAVGRGASQLSEVGHIIMSAML